MSLWLSARASVSHPPAVVAFRIHGNHLGQGAQRRLLLISFSSSVHFVFVPVAQQVDLAEAGHLSLAQHITQRQLAVAVP